MNLQMEHRKELNAFSKWTSDLFIWVYLHEEYYISILKHKHYVICGNIKALPYNEISI